MVRQLLKWRQIVFGAACFGLAWCFYSSFDRVNIDIMATWLAAILVGGIVVLRGYRSYLLLFAAACVVFLVGGEIALRVCYFGVPGLSFDRYRPAEYGHPFSRMEYDASTYTGLKPNMRTIFKGSQFTLNAEGFRGKDYTREKPAGTYRIVMTGASVTLGATVADNEVASEIIERGLNAENLGKHVEVVNLSISASRYGHQLHVLREVGMAYHPDLIMFLANESIQGKEIKIEPRHCKPYEGPLWTLMTHRRYRFFAQRFFFVQVMDKARRGLLVPRNPLEHRMGTFSMGHLFMHPVQFVRNGFSLPPTAPVKRPSAEAFLSGDECEAILQDYPNVVKGLTMLREIAGDVPVAVYLLRPMEGAYDVEAARKFRSVLLHECEKRGMMLMDTYTMSLSGYKPYDLMPYPGEDHPGPLVHKLVGEYVVRLLTPVIKEQIAAAAGKDGPP